MLELVNTEGWLKYIGDRKVHTVTDAEAYIQRILDNPLYFYHVIEMNDTTDPVGIISFLKRDDQKYFDLGFALLPAYEGQGIASEAANKYLTTIQSQQEFENIIAICVPENLKSISVLKKLGFSYQYDYKQGEEVLSIYMTNFHLQNKIVLQQES
jgi:RimJ/RimL family protein N-acetyltransferase